MKNRHRSSLIPRLSSFRRPGEDPETMMRIVFEFTGGPLDGKTVENEWGEQEEAGRYYALTHHGRIGQRFSVASQYAIDILAEEQLQEERPHGFQKHIYEVTDRVQEDDEVIVRVEYVPPKHPSHDSGERD